MATSIRTLLVGVASAHELDPVLPAALDLARQLDATLHVAHAYELPSPFIVPYVGDARPDAPLQEQHAAVLQERLDAQLQSFAEGARAVSHVVEGSAHQRLCQLAAELGADLLVVGATRRGRIWRNLLGTTAERVLAGSPVPVLVMHQPFFRPVRRVVLTTDLSPLSAAVYDAGAELSASLFRTEPELRALLVLSYDVELPPPLPPDLLEKTAREELGRFLAARPHGRQAEPRVRVGEPAREIVQEATDWQADVVVLGTHGRAGLERFVLGSVAESVVRGATCNVLVLPAAKLPPAAEPGNRTEVVATAR